MITRNRARTVLTLAAVAMAIVGLTATQASAKLVVEEQFAYEILDPDGVDAQTPLDGLDGGIGFDGAWTATQSHGRLLRVGLLIFANGEPLTFNDDRGLHFTDVNGDELRVAGAAVSRYGAAGRTQADRLLSAESQAALTKDNTTIWFSALAGGSSNYTNSFFLFGTDLLKIGDHIIEGPVEFIKGLSHAFDLERAGKFGKTNGFKKTGQIPVGLVHITDQ